MIGNSKALKNIRSELFKVQDNLILANLNWTLYVKIL